MLVDFASLPEESRVWIYQSSRTFSETELVEVHEAIKAFLQDWTAHGSDLNAGYELPYNRFIVIGLDQRNQGATGCSIDLLDKMNVSYKQGEFVAYKTLLDFKAMAKNKSVSKNTIVFNNLVTNKEEYLNHWEVPAEESWHNRFM